jgi:hypothetical protein
MVGKPGSSSTSRTPPAGEGRAIAEFEVPKSIAA